MPAERSADDNPSLKNTDMSEGSVGAEGGRAKELGLEGYLDLTRDELVEELRHH